MPTNPSLSTDRPIHWILDWDGTITRKDTLNALVNISASNKPNFPTLDHWNRLSQAYLSDYTQELEKHTPGGTLPATIQDEKKLLKALKPVEQRSLDRVSSSGIFAGLTGTLLDLGAENAIESKQVELRQGFPSFLKYVHSRTKHQGDVINLLSVNWSRRFITSSLHAAHATLDSGLVLANELEGVEAGRSSDGCISPGDEMKIISSDDKLRYMERLRGESKEAGEVPMIVYIGDSWTDIECLLAADLGICMRDDPLGSSQKALAEALERLGISCPRLQDRSNADEWGVVWVRDFAEIQRWFETATS